MSPTTCTWRARSYRISRRDDICASVCVAGALLGRERFIDSAVVRVGDASAHNLACVAATNVPAGSVLHPERRGTAAENSSSSMAQRDIGNAIGARSLDRVSLRVHTSRESRTRRGGTVGTVRLVHCDAALAHDPERVRTV